MPEHMPDIDEIQFKPEFKEKYSQLTDWDAFREYSLSWLRKSIRINTLKTSVDHVKAALEHKWTLTQVPWCREGFWIQGERRDFGNIPEHMLGYFYIQEAASMIPPLVLDPQPGELVLDMCAAPGSKTTQISQYMENEGILLANDIQSKRLAALGVNTQRCGCLNVVMTQMKGHQFKDLNADRILVDAPCSGTGTIRKSLKTIDMWNPTLCKKLAGQQRQLLRTAVENTRPGGVIVYSTCTLEPEENEAVVSWALENLDVEIEKVELPGLKRSAAVTEWDGEQYHEDVKECIRIYPQDNDTEGFFVARLRKV